MVKSRINIYKNNKAQAALETTLALICVMVLLFGTLKVFFWFTERIVRRQEDFEAGRVQAGSIGPDGSGVYVNESNYQALDIFGESH